MLIVINFILHIQKQYESSLSNDRNKQSKSKSKSTSHDGQSHPLQQGQIAKNDNDKKLQLNKDIIKGNEQDIDTFDSEDTKIKKQQNKLMDKFATKNFQQDQMLQQIMNTEHQKWGTAPVSEDMKVCFQILQQLKKNESSGPFLQRVDAEAQQCLDYYKVIKDPMDLSKVESNLKQGIYQTRQQFADDVKKIWNNSFQYNKQGSQIYKMTEDMNRQFEKLYGQIKNQSLIYQPLTPQQHEQDPKKKKKLKLEKQDIPLTINEKKQLGMNIRRLAPEDLNGIWCIVSDSQHNDDIIEFDIDTLPLRKARELETYVKEKAALQIKKQRVQKMNLSNLTSHSNTSTQDQSQMSTNQVVQTSKQSQLTQVQNSQSGQNQVGNFNQQKEKIQQNLVSTQNNIGKSNQNQKITSINQLASQNQIQGPNILQYPQQNQQSNQISSGQYTQPLSAQQIMQNKMTKEYKNISNQPNENSQQGQYQSNGNNSQNQYNCQTQNNDSSNGINNRSFIQNQQIEYSTNQNGIGQYPMQQKNNYSQQHQTPFLSTQQMSIQQYGGGGSSNTTQIHNYSYNYQSQNDKESSEQSSDGITDSEDE